jgi:hypothetical protein
VTQQSQVAIVGARALRRDVNRLCTDERSAVFSAMKKAGYAAVSPLVPIVRGALPTSGRADTQYHKSGALTGSARVSAYKSGAALRVGSKAIPYAPWVEFGGTRKRPHTSTRPYIPDGRYIFPAARGDAARAAAAYSDALTEVFASDAIWTNASPAAGSVHD